MLIMIIITIKESVRNKILTLINRMKEGFIYGFFQQKEKGNICLPDDRNTASD